MVIFYGYVQIYSNVAIAIINHPPFITINMGGIPTIKNGWFILVYDIAITTLIGYDRIMGYNLVDGYGHYA